MIVMLVLLVIWPAYNVVLALFVWWHPKPAATSQDTNFRFWIVIPALNEELVIAATVAGALALDSEQTPVTVLVVNDGSDDGTLAILESIKDRRLQIMNRQLPDARRGKGEALNAAYRYIRRQAQLLGYTEKCIIGIIDGDGRGKSGMLQVVANYFLDSTVGGVQSRVRIHNRDRVLGFLQDIEFACVADASQSLRDGLGSADLGGNGQFVRLSSLALLGDAPWSPCLVEDLELGLRLHLQGVKIRYASKAVVTQQGLVDVRRILRQRTRWSQGNFQCLRYVPRLISSPYVRGHALLEFLYYLVAPWLTVLITIFVAGVWVLTAYGMVTGFNFGGLIAGRVIGVEPVVIMVSAFFAPGLCWSTIYWLKTHDEPLWRAVLTGLIYPAFLIVGIVATWRAFARHVTGRNSWTKTERLIETSTLVGTR